MDNKKQMTVAILLLAALALTRFIPGEAVPLNFSAVYAVVFCAGVYFRSRKALAILFAALLAMDFVVSKIIYGFDFFHPALIGNYLGYLLIFSLGGSMGRKAAFWRLICGGVLGALAFYVVTNFCSWIWNPAYPKTLSGLIQALTVGEPGWPHTWMFFRNTLLSGGLFTGFFVGVMKLAEAAEPESEEAEESENEPEADLEPEESGA